MRTGWMLLLTATLLFGEAAAGLRWTAPAGWISQGPTPMRAVTYTIPGAEKAECVIYFFGAGQGGSVEANLDRWKGQFAQNGKPAEAKVAHRKVNGIAVTTIDISGTYTATGGQARAGQAPEPGYRMLAAVAEGPGGNIFIRFIGKQKVVAAAATAYAKLLNSLQRD